MPTSTFVHPRLLRSLGALFTGTCQMQRRTGAVDAAGEADPDGWEAVPGMEAIQCRLGAASGREIKRPDQTYAVATHSILLSGSYPSISERMRAVVAGVAYDVLLVRTDSTNTITMLDVQVVR